MKRSAWLCAAALALLGACADSGEPPPSEEFVTHTGEGTYAPDRVPDGVSITALGDLIGEYRVAAIDDREITGNTGIALSVDGGLLSFEPTCAGFVWAVRFEGGTLILERFREPATEVPAGEIPPPPKPVCTVGILPQWQQLASALDTVTRAERTSQNAIRLSGGGRSVTLFSQ